MMHKCLILLLLAIFLGESKAFLFGNDDSVVQAVSDIDATCVTKAQEGDCEFYKCFVTRHPCAGFLVRSLYPTCSEMTRRKSEMTQQGQKWLTESRQCFHTYLIQLYSRPGLKCGMFKNAVIRHYMHCGSTVQPNMCQIFYQNREVITRVLKLSPEDLLENPRTALKNIMGLTRMLADCSVDHITDFINQRAAILSQQLRLTLLPWERPPSVLNAAPEVNANTAEVSPDTPPIKTEEST